MLEKPQTTNHKLPTEFIFAGKNKSIEEDKSRSSKLFKYKAFVVRNQKTPDIEGD
jgi:hypothetical protein